MLKLWVNAFWLCFTFWWCFQNVNFPGFCNDSPCYSWTPIVLTLASFTPLLLHILYIFFTNLLWFDLASHLPICLLLWEIDVSDRLILYHCEVGSIESMIICRLFGTKWRTVSVFSSDGIDMAYIDTRNVRAISITITHHSEHLLVAGCTMWNLAPTLLNRYKLFILDI